MEVKIDFNTFALALGITAIFITFALISINRLYQERKGEKNPLNSL
ncbi:hypothetical protein BCF55_1713 [Hydrogenivirga caldilitoris]|uniref:Uncharacterized protein n=1 Tax=Hydrogenivirga caldilitoris TaxID=246264 RepID=A0A497XT18_9AQUI|nr:hypothetical protein BCF55_1713 [Hydrogenivirga caldilitoris]